MVKPSSRRTCPEPCKRHVDSGDCGRNYDHEQRDTPHLVSVHLKLLVIVDAGPVLLLASYHLAMGDTPIGVLLNGLRRRRTVEPQAA